MAPSSDCNKLLCVSIVSLGAYGVAFVAVPKLAYKIFVRGGWGPVSENKNVQEEPDVDAKMLFRWFGLSCLNYAILSGVMTDCAEKNVKDGLNAHAAMWASGAAMHGVGHVTGAMPKEVCIFQAVAQAGMAMALANAASDQGGKDK